MGMTDQVVQKVEHFHGQVNLLRSNLSTSLQDMLEE
jgi:hypothetical protein